MMSIQYFEFYFIKCIILFLYISTARRTCLQYLPLPKIRRQLLINEFFPSLCSKFPPSLYAVRISKAQQEEIAGAFLVTLDPLITQLLTFQPFVQVVLDSRLGKFQKRFSVKSSLINYDTLEAGLFYPYIVILCLSFKSFI